jgi:hypothetical protein
MPVKGTRHGDEQVVAILKQGDVVKKLLAPVGLRAAACYVVGQNAMSERHACRPVEVGTIQRTAIDAPTGTRCRTAGALERVGRAAHAVWVSTVDGDVGARRGGSKITFGNRKEFLIPWFSLTLCLCRELLRRDCAIWRLGS